MGQKIVIAVDGPAASGKGTISRRLAAQLNLAYLDTGLLYRATAARVVTDGVDPYDPESCANVATRLNQADLDRDDLRTEETGRVASIVAAHPDVRDALLDFQRQFAANPPDDKQGAVLDGRDIGTVVCPEATAKLYITASVPARAERRYNELSQSIAGLTYADVLKDIETRDARDMGRSTAPLAKAKDADLLDTTDLGIEGAVDAAFASIKRQVPHMDLT